MYNKQGTTSNPFANNQRTQFGNCGDFFNHKFDRHGFGKRGEWKNKFQDFFAGRKSANIIEDENTFTIALYAAGLEKNNFKVSVSDDVLSIQYTAAEEENNSTQYAHREYKPVSFERSFHLNGRALTNNISATYTDGVLKVTLQKNPETNKPTQEISVD